MIPQRSFRFQRRRFHNFPGSGNIRALTYMAATPPRIARVPHTTKRPERCPYCGGSHVSRKGTRRKKIEIVQLWRCFACKRTFTPGPAALRNKTYPLRMILSALTDYNTGYSLRDTAARLQKKTNRNVSPSTITKWLHEYKQLCTYQRWRARGLARFSPAQTIRSIKLYHRQIYSYAYHRAKLDFLRRGVLDDKRKDDTRFAPLADFLERVPTDCPHDLFTREGDTKGRASQATATFADTARAIVNVRTNAATDTAALIIPAIGNNKLRHETLQRFMLANDSVTVAVEIPIWLTEKDIAAIESRWGITLAPKLPGQERIITGHIDFVQVRNGAIHILDYKPDATTNKPFAQLTIYALALSHLAGIPLFDFKCAWFNEHQYCEFFPRTILRRNALALSETRAA
jgi:transposase-like protein